MNERARMDKADSRSADDHVARSVDRPAQTPAVEGRPVSGGRHGFTGRLSPRNARQLGRHLGNQGLQRALARTETPASPLPLSLGEAVAEANSDVTMGRAQHVAPPADNGSGASEGRGVAVQAPSAPLAALQRDPAPAASKQDTGSWKPPFDYYETVKTKHGAKTAASYIRLMLRKLKTELEEADVETGLEAVELALEEAIVWQNSMSGPDPLTSGEAENLTGFGKDAEKAYERGIRALGAHAASGLGPLADAEVPDTTAAEDDLAEAMHYAFIEGSDDGLATAKEALETLSSYKGKAEKVLGWAKKAAEKAKAAKTLEQLEKAIGKLKSAGDVVDKVKDVVIAARAFSQIAGLEKQAPASYKNDLNKFEAALDAIDLGMSFFKAVPLVGTLWSDYYSPVTRHCLKLIGKIKRADDYKGRELAFFEFLETGTLSKGLAAYFPGGLSVLRFMVAIMRDQEPAATSGVQKFFLENKDLFNVGESSWNKLESEGGSKWYNPWTWGDSESLQNLMPWVKRNRQQVWGMLYGKLTLE